MNKDAMDVDTAETIAGVVRLLRRAAVLAWAAADRAGAGSPRQLLALGVDLAADEARQLVPVGTDLDGPIPVGDDPAGLLTSASLLLGRLGGTRRVRCAARPADGRGQPGVGGEHRCRRLTGAASVNSSPTATYWPERRCSKCLPIGRSAWCVVASADQLRSRAVGHPPA